MATQREAWRPNPNLSLGVAIPGVVGVLAPLAADIQWVPDRGEPRWEAGKAVRWCIQQPGEVPMGIGSHPCGSRAGTANPLLSFAILTVSGEGHPVFKRMHRQDDEKRMVVIL